MMVAYTEGEEGDGGQGAGGGRLSIRSYGSTGSSVDSSPSPTFLQYTPAPGEQHAHAATHPLNGLHHSAHQNILLNAAASGKCK
ncbi:unnamed protein product [Anisakis simplex]|uniref:Homeobox protein homothorax n=1 Tax=Anisakis simplex TaxID=6269 RepID=A0A0M3JG67_ANISI|nr:unnamed protein product [Anisakis simplex]